MYLFFILSLNFQSMYSKLTSIQVKETKVQNAEKTKKYFYQVIMWNIKRNN